MAGTARDTGETVSIELPVALLHSLEKEGRRRHKTVAAVIAQMMQDREDFVAAEKVMKRVREGKEKLVPATEVYARLGI